MCVFPNLDLQTWHIRLSLLYKKFRTSARYNETNVQAEFQ